MRTQPSRARVTIARRGGLAAGGRDAGNGSDAAADRSSAPTQTTQTASADPELTASPAGAGRCAMPSAEGLKTQDTAFAGTVSALADGTATLDVTHWYKGGDSDTVEVTAPSKQLQDLLLAVDFQQGQSYLVSAVDGQVSVCGMSGPQDEMLESMYAEAFGS